MDYYFAYGSNMNLEQMEYRCPDSWPIVNVVLDGYRLAFRGNSSGCGVATILPEKDSRVEGVMWQISEQDEAHLDRYEGYPNLYGKERVQVRDGQGRCYDVMVYTMQTPYREQPALPSQGYLRVILDGCAQNGLAVRPVLEAVQNTQAERCVNRTDPQRAHWKSPHKKSNPER